ncbi:MAG: PA14 domain-containing protein [Cyclobacteriaceae bacterium]
MKKCLIYSSSLKLQSLIYVCGIVLMEMLMACEGKKEPPVRHHKLKKKETKALSLIRKEDCLTCHSIEDKSAAPAYVKIAQRYEADEITVDKLADKIIAGGGGMWFGGVMTEHPYLKRPDAIKIVRWILSLDDSITNRDPMFHTEGIRLAESFREPVDGKLEKNGLILKAYSLKSFGDNGAAFPDIRKEMKPLHSGVVKKIHLPTPQSFKPLSKGFVLQATGFIHIKTQGEYFFKQVRTGKGRVFLNGEAKINENDWDSEVLIDLSPGIYPIKIDYQSGEGVEKLSLQWITPEEEYYQVIPEEVFTYN